MPRCRSAPTDGGAGRSWLPAGVGTYSPPLMRTSSAQTAYVLTHLPDSHRHLSIRRSRYARGPLRIASVMLDPRWTEDRTGTGPGCSGPATELPRSSVESHVADQAMELSDQTVPGVRIASLQDHQNTAALSGIQGALGTGALASKIQGLTTCVDCGSVGCFTDERI